jgi:hypothetical protein
MGSEPNMKIKEALARLRGTLDKRPAAHVFLESAAKAEAARWVAHDQEQRKIK